METGLQGFPPGPSWRVVAAGVVSVDFSSGRTVATREAKAGRPILLSFAGAPSASGVMYSTSVVEGVSFGIDGDAVLGTVSVAWQILDT